MVLATNGLDEILLLIPIGALSATMGAVAVSLPSIRVSGWALALTSFFFVVSIPELVAALGTYTGGLPGWSIYLSRGYSEPRSEPTAYTK